MLVFGDDSPAYELQPDTDKLRQVDLAGHHRSLAAHPRQDPTTGELHLIVHDIDGRQAHVVVSAGALTRHSRPLIDAPARIRDLALSRDHIVLIADGHVGIARREGEPRTTWVATGIAAAHLVHAHDTNDTVVVVALTPQLERWTLPHEVGSIQHEVLDPTPRRFAHPGNHSGGGAPRYLWTTGNETIGHHDLANECHVHHSLRAGVPGDLVFVADATRDSDADGGWLIGFVHDPAGAGSELYVIDAADIRGPVLTTAPIPRLVPQGLRCTWIPSLEHRHAPQPPSTKESRP
jgi:carotenoid cleavage dioxygenase